jgi:hypothetical protein
VAAPLHTRTARAGTPSPQSARRARDHSLRRADVGQRRATTRQTPPAGAFVVRVSELMKFRHFARYYYEFDWRKLDYLAGVLREAHPKVLRDFQRFEGFLQRLVDAGE